MSQVQLALPTLGCLDVLLSVMRLNRTNGQFKDNGVATVTSFMMPLLLNQCLELIVGEMWSYGRLAIMTINTTYHLQRHGNKFI